MSEQMGGVKGVVGGNFNMVLHRNERSGDNFSVSVAQNFKEILTALVWKTFHLKGGWTWNKRRDQPSFSRTDIFLVSIELLLSLPGLSQKVLPRPISNHFAICLTSYGIQWGSIPF